MVAIFQYFRDQLNKNVSIKKAAILFSYSKATRSLWFTAPLILNSNDCFFFLKEFLTNSSSPLSCPLGGVIAYISSGSASSPDSFMSTSPNNGSYLSTSAPVSRPSLPSRAVGMVVDIAPPAKIGHQRSHGVEKAGRSSTSAKSSITSK